jgi:hypothetical protein
LCGHVLHLRCHKGAEILKYNEGDFMTF